VRWNGLGPSAAFIRAASARFKVTLTWRIITAMDDETRDISGAVVRVGTRVRVLKISSSVLSQLPQSEADCARSMEGEVFEVYEIDEWGGAWVEKWWRAADGTSSSHSLGLGPSQMEVVSD
jgi:hypothetical protein